MMRTHKLFLTLFIIALLVDQVYSWIPSLSKVPFISKVRDDFLALTRRATARHILLPPNRELALALKHKIRQKCQEVSPETGRYPFVVDVFSAAAQKYSRDDTTNFRGGLLGELVPQGYCRDPVLDRACFEVRLGEIEGPIESDYGYHLLLVEERTNCPKLDGRNTKLVPCENHGFGQIVPSQQVGQVDMSKLIRDQVLFWIAAFFAGGLVAEAATSLGDAFVNTQ